MVVGLCHRGIVTIVTCEEGRNVCVCEFGNGNKNLALLSMFLLRALLESLLWLQHSLYFEGKNFKKRRKRIRIKVEGVRFV